jgi:hypothetical protein
MGGIDIPARFFFTTGRSPWCGQTSRARSIPSFERRLLPFGVQIIHKTTESQLLFEQAVLPKYEIGWEDGKASFGALNDLRVNGPGSTSCTSSYQTPSAGGGTSTPYTTCRYTPTQTLMRCRRGSWTDSSRISTQTSGETRYARELCLHLSRRRFTDTMALSPSYRPRPLCSHQ